MNKYSKIFFKEESKKIEQLLANVHVRKFFYTDIKEMIAVAIENSYNSDTFTINVSGNVGIGTTVTTALNIVKN